MNTRGGSKTGRPDGLGSVADGGWGGGWDGPDLRISGEQLNDGLVLVEVRSDGADDASLLWSYYVSTVPILGYPGSGPAVRTPYERRVSRAAVDQNDYAIVYDIASGRWSDQAWSDVGLQSL
jgi:hypothetical protein